MKRIRYRGTLNSKATEFAHVRAWSAIRGNLQLPLGKEGDIADGWKATWRGSTASKKGFKPLGGVP
jgi:hypothetical protein